MPAFHAEPGLPYWIEILSSNPTASASFYRELMGWEFSPEIPSSAGAEASAESAAERDGATESVTEASAKKGSDHAQEEGYYIARKHGLPVAGIVGLPEESAFSDTWITYFMSSDITASVAEIQSSGSQILIEPTRVEVGTMAVAMDPAGAVFGLIEPDGAAFIAAGEPGCPVWYENMVMRDFETVLTFYRNLLSWDIKETGISTGTRYAMALWEGAPCAGLYDAKIGFPPGASSFWQIFLGVQNIEEAAGRVSALGGEIIEGPVDSELGRICQIVDSTGALTMLCEVEEPPREEARESDDLLDLVDHLE